MSSKLLNLARSINKPLVKQIISRGWYIRLQSKKLKKAKFTKLTKVQKKEIKKFWKNFGKKVSSDWTAYYSYGSKIVDAKYIPESLFYSEILPKLNDEYIGNGLADKNLYDNLFNTNMPKTIFRKVNGVLLNKDFSPISLEDAISLSKEASSIVIKPSDGSYGSGIVFWDNKKNEREILNALKLNDNIIVQEKVKQHEFLNSIHSSSLNTLRVVTLMLDNEVIYLCTILRMGQNNSQIDNYSAGGLICSIDKDGKLFEKAVQSNQSVIYKHPNGFVFKNKVVPHFDKVINHASTMHYKIPYFKFVSWDYSITEDGEPILIEANFPASQIDLHQLNIGPIFGEYTERVLSEVYFKN